jgi:antitoxin ParD1/3/4
LARTAVSGVAFRKRRFLLLLSSEVRMAKVEKITVALSEDTLSAVRDAAASGEYASTGEVVRDALRDWKMKHRLSQIELDEMRRFVQEGADSGPGIDAERVFGRLRAKYAAM